MFSFLSVEWHETLPSTNTHLLECTRQAEEIPSGTVVVARCQTAGRGRMQRVWQGGEGGNLTFSFLVRANVDASCVPLLSLAVGVGLAAYLDAQSLPVSLKWPNDCLVGGKKIAGILIESVTPGNVADGFVVGIGLNVNMTGDDARTIPQPATSLAIETGNSLPVGQVLDELLPFLATWVSHWEAGEGALLREAWLARAHNLGHMLTVCQGEKTVSGVFTGLDETGALCLQKADGTLITVWSGDVAVS